VTATPLQDPAAPSERLLSGWGRTAPTRATVLAPRDRAEVAAALAAAGPRGAIARGLGRSYGDAAQNAGGAVLAMRALRGGIVVDADADAAVARAPAGVSLGELIDRALPLGLLPPVLPGTRFVTVGGAIAADVHGKNHPRDGSFATHVQALELVTPAGAVLDLGAGEDAFAATAGGMGLTGVITRATLVLRRVETAWMSTRTVRVRSLDDALALLATDGPHAHHAIAWIDAAGARGDTRAIVTLARHAALTDLPAAVARTPLARRPRRTTPRAPRWAPSSLLSPPLVAAFNEARWRAAARARGDRLVALEDGFFPLDGVRGWNRLYGAGGLVQEQVAVPSGCERAIASVLAIVRAARFAPPLVTLKRLGPGRGGLSFPIAGWTLALDFPARAPGLGAVLDAIEDRVAAVGGRVYLAKDARLRPQLLAPMYPDLDAWRAARARLDPAARMRSDLARRLEIA
jgi:decaprenylphospho-beta-D-ribofuranose 2-oxidase